MANCRRLWDAREALHRDTAEVYWEEVVEEDFLCDLEGEDTQITGVRRSGWRGRLRA